MRTPPRTRTVPSPDIGPRRYRGSATVGVAVALTLSAGVAPAGTPEMIAQGLSNPRGIGFAPNGALYVAEAGRGGPGPCIPSPVRPVNRCYGETGSIARIKPEGGFERIIEGLPSLVLPDGTAEGGPVEVAFLGTSMYVTMSWGGDPALRAALGSKGGWFGSMLHVTPSGAMQLLVDVAAHESKNNPAGGPVDSNPYGSLALPGRRIVADAGANALLEVSASGRTSTLALPPPLPPVFPNTPPREPVPTSVAEGPDGALYVGQLTAGPFFRGTSTVLRVASDGSSIETFASGFTAVVDLTFDAGGALYVLEVATGFVPGPGANPGLGNGRLLQKCPGAAPTVLLSGLVFPSGVAIGPDGAAYLTNNGVSATAGEVLRLPVTPCP